MAWTDGPHEALEAQSSRAVDDGSARTAEATRRRQHRARLEQALDRMDIRHRPEDSSPAIRRMLGTDRPRTPQRWEQRVAWGADGQVRLRDVPVTGPIGRSSRR